ncbi:MAG: arginase family protein [Bacteroidetes bacterium]|nr:arginase family protein [Bacteroidota bacterium]
MRHFKIFSKEDILSLTRIRKYETKIGERIEAIKNVAEWEKELSESKAKFVIIGIPEDIGVKGNLGIGGADTNWHPFLNSFLNVQSNSFLTGEEMLLLGNFDFGDIKYLIENTANNSDELIDAYRHAVSIIDDEVENIIKLIVYGGKIPVIIGGGHNNAYPIIKGVAKGLKKLDLIPLAQINCINLDAHADYKVTEGRHSGNAFRYADRDGFLQKYVVLGMHESYVQQNVLTDLDESPFLKYFTYEDIFLRNKLSFENAIDESLNFCGNTHIGVEVDVDCIENILSSAYTPCGISILDSRKFINQISTKAKVSYLHISEGACQLVNGKKDEGVGKLLSYLICDFVKGCAKYGV